MMEKRIGRVKMSMSLFIWLYGVDGEWWMVIVIRVYPNFDSFEEQK